MAILSGVKLDAATKADRPILYGLRPGLPAGVVPW